jgi:acetate kinase
MTIMTLNVGSTSIKFSIFNDKTKLGSYKTDDINKEISNYKPDIIVMRVVFGGSKYDKPMVMNMSNLKELMKYNNFAPLHNPITCETMKGILERYTNIMLIAVFDSAFHSSISPERYTIPISAKLSKDLELRKYGFHGLSNQYISTEYARLNNTNKFKIIVCHLGGGSSVTAIQDGISLANSMGFGPEEGLMMVKRVGNIGANAILHIIENTGLNIEELRKIIYTQSGFLGLTGSDDIKKVFISEDKNCKLATKIYINNLLDYIGAYNILLQGADAVILTGGIGENSSYLQQIVKESLAFLNLKVMVIPTLEDDIMRNLIDMI